jgi:phytoene dehydrogenase-like protein
MRDLHQERAALDYPIGGSEAVVAALVRGFTKNGQGTLELNSHVEEVLVEEGRAVGVKLRRKGVVVRAKRAVISNASVWDTMKLIPKGEVFILL